MTVPIATNRVPGPLTALVAIVLILVSSGFVSASGPDGRVRGFLTDSVSGAPVAGASVRIEAYDLPWAFQATTDASGSFDLVAPPHRYSLSAWAPAYLRNLTTVALGSGQTVWVNMTLSPAAARTARLQGVVTETGSGAPVTSGRVAARPPWWAGSGTYTNASALDGTGSYAIDLVPGSYEVATEDVVGYAAFTDYPVSVGTGQIRWYNISLIPNPVDAWINGTVFDADTSAPIAGAEVTARVDGLLIPAVTSDASGVYSLRVPSGSVELAADALGYAPASTTVNVFGMGQYVVNLYLVPLSRSIRGIVVDGVTGARLAGVTVTVDPLFFNGYFDQATTNASGSYEAAVPDDYYIVSARAPGYAAWSTWVLFFSDPVAWANATLWPIISRVSGTLVDAADGSPVPGLVVGAVDLRSSHSVSTTADGTGFFTLAVPPSPAMSVWAYGQGPYAGNVAYVRTTPYATTWVNITIDRLAAQIVANVTDALTGLPIVSATVSAGWYYGADWGVTDANGSSTVDAPVGVDVYVTATAIGYSFWIGLVRLLAGANPLSIALFPDLSADVRIRGYVRDASSGLGMSSVNVEAIGFDDFPPNDYTNSTGYYELGTVAAPQTIRAAETRYAAGEASVNPSAGEILWVNLTLTPDANAPRAVTLTATPSSGIDVSNPAALQADVNETNLERADLSILMLHSAAAGVGTFLNLGALDSADVAVASPTPGLYAVSASWDTRTRVGRLSDGLTSLWWPVLFFGGPFLGIVNGYFDNATLTSPIAGSAVFDTRDGRLLFVLTSSGSFIGPQDQPGATFAPFAVGTRIDLTTAAIVGSTLVTGPALFLGSLGVAIASSVPSGTYAALLQLWDSAGAYTQAAVLLQTAADTVPPLADAGPDVTVDEDTLVTLDGSASSDNVGITSYEWTFVDGSTRRLSGASPGYTFASPGTYVITLTVQDSDGNVGTATVTVTVRDVTDPTLTVTSPSEGESVSGSVAISVNATDNVGVERVELRVDGVSVGNDTTLPFGFVLGAGNLGLGNHTLEVWAFDAAGNAAVQVRRVTVVASSAGPFGSDFVILGGLGLLAIVAAVAFAFLLMKRRRYRPPAAPPEAVEETPSSNGEAFVPEESVEVDGAEFLEAGSRSP